MVSQGPKYAGAVGTNSWTNPSNAIGSDEITCATASTIISGFWNTFGFSLPAGAVIEGIFVETKVSKTVTQTASVTLVVGKNEATLGTEAAAQSLSNVACGASQPILSWGGSTALWGLSWTPNEINSASFCVRVTSVQARAKALNWIKVTVYYHIQNDVSVSESLGFLSDGVNYVLLRARISSEGIGAVSDTVEKTTKRIQDILEPSLSASDNVTAEKFTPSIEISVNEPSISVSDLPSYNAQRTRTPSESLGSASDSISLAITRVLALTELAISISDSVFNSLVLARSSPETLGGISDSLGTNLLRAMPISETPITLFDAVASLLRRNVEVPEPQIPVLDSIASTVTRILNILEPSLSVSDLPNYVLQRTVTLNESSISISDLASYVLHRGRELSETPILTSDLLNYNLQRVISLLEGLGNVADSTMRETITPSGVKERAVSEDLGIVTDVPQVRDQKLSEVLENLGFITDSTVREIIRRGLMMAGCEEALIEPSVEETLRIIHMWRTHYTRK